MIDELKQKIIALIESKFQDLTVENIVLDSVGRNKYSDIYFISVFTKDIKLKIVAKIKKPTSPLHKIRGEYDSYMDLSDILKKSPYRTLDVIGYTECPNSLVSIFAEGEILSDLMLRKSKATGSLVNKLNLKSLQNYISNAGELLAFYHNSRLYDNTESRILNPAISYILDEFDISLSTIQEGNYFFYADCYQDFAPWNIIVTSNMEICLIDPPRDKKVEMVYYDIAKFRLGLKSVCYHPYWFLRNGFGDVDSLFNSFLDGYINLFEKKFNISDILLIDLYELMIWREIRADMEVDCSWKRNINLKYIGKLIRHRFHSKMLQDSITSHIRAANV